MFLKEGVMREDVKLYGGSVHMLCFGVEYDTIHMEICR